MLAHELEAGYHLQVFLHAIIVFYYIEHGKSKLARAGPYLQWERPHKMLKILVWIHKT